MQMQKPERLRRGDRVAVVSLSSGLGGEESIRHRYELGLTRLREEFGLEPVAMPGALKGIEYLDAHPEVRAGDMMQAFRDPSVKGVLSMIGGEDTIRLLPYIDFAVLRDNPKVFLGFSDTTVNHFMLRRAGVASFYGPALLTDFAENVAMPDYTREYIRRVLFQPEEGLEILPSPVWTSEYLDWGVAANSNIARALVRDDRGYICLQGSGVACGPLIGGCLDVLPMLWDTPLWPGAEEWDGAVLFLETSEDCISSDTFRTLLRGLAARGILNRVGAVLLAKPLGEKYEAEYHEALVEIIGREARRPDMPVLANLSCGHTSPMCVLPLGQSVRVNCDAKTITLVEPAVL